MSARARRIVDWTDLIRRQAKRPLEPRLAQPTPIAFFAFFSFFITFFRFFLIFIFQDFYIFCLGILLII